MLTLLPLLMLAFALASISTPAAADFAPETRQQRADFLAAEQALRRGDSATFDRLLGQLRDYPLYPYLRYQQLQRRLASAPNEEIAAFVRAHAGSPVAERLHQSWMLSLAQRKQWDALLKYYPAHAAGAELECYRRRALHHAGRVDEALAGVESLWLVPRSQPAACDPLFSIWQQRGGVTPELAWQRFRLAMGANEITLARYLVRFMDEPRKEWAELWLRVHASPRLLESRQRPAAELPARDDILAHGMRRLVRTDLERAVRVWDQAQQESPMTTEARAGVERSLATALAVRRHPQAVERLAAVDEAWSDSAVREWRVRTPLARGDWQGVLAAISRMGETEREAPDWRYWQARALEALGQTAQAEEIYLDLALARGYYSFLAADRLGRPYELRHAPLTAEDATAVTPEAYPGIARARELYLLGRIVDARREWQHATRDMAVWQLKSAAALAQGWGWHDRAILTLARTDLRDDLELRFPLAHREQILAQAKASDIDPALAFAIVRQESAFAPDARSSAGALGLMQLMPATAQRLAASLDMPLGNRLALLDVATNLRLGMTYLRQMLDRYGHQTAALAAYNAGPHRVDGWLPTEDLVEADVWADIIPFRETRNYVQNVMFFSAIYEHRMELPAGRLAHRMPVVVPRDARLTRGTGAAPQPAAARGSGAG